MAEAKKASPKRIIDVTHADKTPTAATSKPVIVTNRPILQDPMVVDKSDEKDPEAATSGGTTIQPLTAPEVPDSAAAETPESSEPAEKPAAEETKEPAKPKPKLDPTKTLAQIDDEVKAKAPETQESAKEEPETETSDDAKAEENPDAANPGAEEAAKAEAQAQRDASLQKLVDDKKLFLPINTVENRRSKRVVVIGVLLSIILALAWVDIALDAGLIELGNVQPVTHFFST
jgi:hypothetical protein